MSNQTENKRDVMIQFFKKVDQLAHLFKSRNEVASWYSAYKLGWLVAKAPKGINERSIEVPWILKEAGEIEEKGHLLDIGSYLTSLPQALYDIGFKVTTLDLRGPSQASVDTVDSVVGDIRRVEIADETFDHVTCVSTLEHIGVKGRYGVQKADPDGDIKAMDEIHRLLTPGGDLLITIPIGACNVFPANRCYRGKRLDRIFSKFKSVKEAYYIHKKDNCWKEVDRKDAQRINWYTCDWYALGCFRLRKSD